MSTGKIFTNQTNLKLNIAFLLLTSMTEHGSNGKPWHIDLYYYICICVKYVGVLGLEKPACFFMFANIIFR